MVKTFIKSKLNPETLKKTITEDLAGTVTFVDGDRVTLAGKKSGEVTMTRVKADAATKQGA